MSETLRFVDGPQKGTLDRKHVAPQVKFGVVTDEGICEDRYTVFDCDGGEFHYKFEGRWRFPVSCVAEDCETCAADPSLREWKQVDV